MGMAPSVWRGCRGVGPSNREIRLKLAVGGSLDAEPSTIRPETRFDLSLGTIFGYLRFQFEESSGECRLTGRTTTALRAAGWIDLN